MKPTALLFFALLIFSCNNPESPDSKNQKAEEAPRLREEAVTYTSDTTQHQGYVAYNENLEGKLPVVFVVHEWWGLTEYPKERARQLAQMGYLAFAVDMYGNGRLAETPGEAGALATPFYLDPNLIKTRFDAAVARAAQLPNADLSKAAAIGYCYGGYCVLNAAKMGADLKGVVVFHGNLSGVPAQKEQLKADILVCHGAADPLVPEAEVSGFRRHMDSIGASYTFKAYPGATHAFTNPAATEKGKKFNLPVAYNAAADSASWQDMKEFLSRVLN